jgi:hypothetical protein
MPVREGRILQENQGEMRSPKLPPNPEKGIKTILHQFLNSLARVLTVGEYLFNCLKMAARFILEFIGDYPVANDAFGIRPSILFHFAFLVMEKRV